MMTTEELKKEHQAIKLMLNILEKVCTKLEGGQEIDLEHLVGMVDFFRVFADKCHHAKEENVLFPAMKEVDISEEGGPIGVMLKEHDRGREFVKGMNEGIEAYKAGGHKSSSKFVENARNYAVLLINHIYKEDNILFPLADAHLPHGEQEKLMNAFERIEVEKIGVNKHEEFHTFINNLKRVYLE